MNNNIFDWDAVRVFLAVAEHQNLSRAAETLNLSQPTAGRYIARLEEQLDVRLFDRRQTGYVLTDAGHRLSEVAGSMARSAADFARAVDLERADDAEQVCRVTLGEWGLHFLSCHAAEITEGMEHVRLELYADDSFWDLSRNSADIAVGNRLPKQPHLIAQKLGDVSFHVYAADSYLARRPEATDPRTWPSQTWAGYCGGRARLKSSLLLNELLSGKPCRYAVNSSTALIDLLKSGQAVGILPDWVAENVGLRRLSDTPLAQGESWMSFHERLRLHPALTKTKDRITQLYRHRFASVGRSTEARQSTGSENSTD